MKEDNTRYLRLNQNADTTTINNNKTLLTITTILFFSIIQLALLACKNRFATTYNKFTLFCLWAFPPIAAIALEIFIFIPIWAVFSATNFYFIYIASKKPLLKQTPGRIFKYLDTTYKACYRLWNFA